MNIYLEKFINKKFKKPGKALDLGAGNFFDVACIKSLGWKCEGVDKKNGINLEKSYKSIKSPFDLVYSNYVLQKIKNKKVFIETAYKNLKKEGWLFIHALNKKDKNVEAGIDVKEIEDIMKSQGFVEIKTKNFSFYDNDPEHRHWHKISEITAKKE